MGLHIWNMFKSSWGNQVFSVSECLIVASHDLVLGVIVTNGIQGNQYVVRFFDVIVEGAVVQKSIKRDKIILKTKDFDMVQKFLVFWIVGIGAAQYQYL